MPRIDRYILAQLVGLFGFFSLILVMIYWINTAAKLFDQVIADGQSAAIFFEFSALSLPNIIFLVAPASAMVAVVYCMNQMGSDSALNVMRATGFSSRQLSLPFVLYGVFVAIILTILAHFLVPLSTQIHKIRQAEISDSASARLFTAGTFIHPIKDVSFYIREIREDGELRNIFLEDNRSPNAKVTYTALRAFLVKKDDGPQLVMIDGNLQQQDKKTKRIGVTTFNDFVFDLGEFSGTGKSSGLIAKHRTTWDLMSSDHPAYEKAYIIAFRTASALNALAAIVLALAAMNSGTYSRFGMWRNIFLAGASFVFLKVSEAVVLDLVDSTRVVGLMFIPFVMGLVIAAAMIIYADKPWGKGQAVLE